MTTHMPRYAIFSALVALPIARSLAPLTPTHSLQLTHSNSLQHTPPHSTPLNPTQPHSTPLAPPTRSTWSAHPLAHSLAPLTPTHSLQLTPTHSNTLNPTQPHSTPLNSTRSTHSHSLAPPGPPTHSPRCRVAVLIGTSSANLTLAKCCLHAWYYNVACMLGTTGLARAQLSGR